jgi:hypothetical protein
MSASHIPKGVGYWGGGKGTDDLPRPQSLVRLGWQTKDLRRIADYLSNGHMYGAWLGKASCRFAGCPHVLGACDFTDGVWVWPEGLEHYLLKHAVCLPDSFVETMQSNDWQVPAACDADRTRWSPNAGCGPFGDLSEWIAWAYEFASSGDDS